MIGQRLSHYVVEARLGEGGMGTVYLARDTVLGREVAIKVLSSAAGADADLASRLLREARAASSLNHPNIVTIHEIGRADGHDFIVMERLAGRALSELIPPGGLPLPQVLDYGIQVAGAIGAAHAAGIVHRDVKPANVMVLPTGQLKVLDFGLARLAPPQDGATQAPPGEGGAAFATFPGAIVGTVGYMAPEQIDGRTADARSDVFSIGVLLFEMLAGRRPFTGDSAWATMAATMTAKPAPVERVRPDAPPGLARLVTRCLEKRPEERYPSAAEVAADLAALKPVATAQTAASRPRLTRLLVAGAIVLALLAAAAVVWTRIEESRQRWARQTAVADVERLQRQGDIVGAYVIARRGLQIAPDDPQLRQLWANIAMGQTITSEPPAARVAFRDLRTRDATWIDLGATPLKNVFVPFTLLHWHITRTGYEPLDVARSADEMSPIRLVRIGTAPGGMVFVPPGEFLLESANQAVRLPGYWLDRYEVTNRQYKAFVDAGGYRRHEYWKEPFVKDGRTLTWEEAMTELRDATGRPGPSTWELGTYPDGQDDYPVSGVSWYEAAAYTAFAGKQLPTVYHWYNASGAFGIFSDVLEVSNFSGRGPVKVGTSGSLGPYGTFDMAGNVKEWCWNATGERRYVLGGSWKDASYQFRDADAQLPFERRVGYGFRCMMQRDAMSPMLTASIKTLARDPATLKPVGNDVFEVYRRLYDYDHTALDARVEETDTSNPAWRRERVTVRTAYGNERLPIYLYLPKTSRPPYQVVVLSPGSNAVLSGSSRNLDLFAADFHVRSGRALVYPVYQGTYERHISGPRGPNVLREILIDRGKDIRRTVDYLETRPDLDASRVAFYGISLGAQLGPVYLVIEPRFRTGVLFSGGFETWHIPPETDPVNFAPRVKQPVLMVNGRQDFDLPYETAQIPLFRMLGTPAAEKRHVVLDGGHIPARMEDPIRVILDWLDSHLGPVQ